MSNAKNKTTQKPLSALGFLNIKKDIDSIRKYRGSIEFIGLKDRAVPDSYIDKQRKLK